MEFISDFLKKNCKRRRRDREISLTDRKHFYDLILAGKVEEFKLEFKKVTEKNFPSLKFSNVTLSLCIILIAWFISKKYCWNPVHLAAWHGQKDILNFLLKTKFKEEWINEKDELVQFYYEFIDALLPARMEIHLFFWVFFKKE